MNFLRNAFWGTINILCVVGLVIILVGTVAFPIFVISDTSFLPTQHGVGQVVSKNFTPTHTEMVPLVLGVHIVPVTNYYKDKWSVTVEFHGKKDSVSVAEKIFNSLSKNESVNVTYEQGRFMGWIHINGILM